MVSPLPSRRFPNSDEIARSSQISGVREEDVVTTGRLAEEGIGVRKGASSERVLVRMPESVAAGERGSINILG